MNFLFAWELGQYLGHVSKIVEVSRALINKGHRVTLVLKNTDGLSSIKGFEKLPSEHYKIILAPCYPDQMVRPHEALTIPEIIYYRGYASEIELERYIKQWLKIFDEEKPDSIIFDYAPTALLSAIIFNQSNNVPLYLFGSGFGEVSSSELIRNRHSAFLTKTAHGRAEEIEKKVVYVINMILDKYSVKKIQYYSEIYSVAHTFLCTYPEFDCYSRDATPHTYVGPIVDLNIGFSIDTVIGNNNVPTIFAYLKPSDNRIFKWVNALKMTDYKVILYCPGLKDIDRITMESESFIILTEPANFRTVFSNCDLIVHNGGHGTLISTIKAGLPSLLIPTQREQLESSKKVEKQGLGLFVYNDDSSQTIATKLKRLITESRFKNAADKISTRNQAINQFDAVKYISDHLITKHSVS